MQAIVAGIQPEQNTSRLEEMYLRFVKDPPLSSDNDKSFWGSRRLILIVSLLQEPKQRLR